MLVCRVLIRKKSYEAVPKSTKNRQNKYFKAQTNSKSWNTHDKRLFSLPCLTRSWARRENKLRDPRLVYPKTKQQLTLCTGKHQSGAYLWGAGSSRLMFGREQQSSHQRQIFQKQLTYSQSTEVSMDSRTSQTCHIPTGRG